MGVLNKILTAANAYLGVTNLAGAASPTQQLEGVPLGTSDGTATGELGLKVISVGGTAAAPTGAAFMASSQVATSTSEATLVSARATRRSVTVKNIDTSITVYIGPSSGVTSVSGLPLAAGESISVDTNSEIKVIAASGTPRVAYIETYD